MFGGVSLFPMPLLAAALSTADANASNSERATRIRPQGVFSQNEWSSSSIAQFTASQGNPFLLFSVATYPFFNRLSPVLVAAQTEPSLSTRMSLTHPSPSPSPAEYDRI